MVLADLRTSAEESKQILLQAHLLDVPVRVADHLHAHALTFAHTLALHAETPEQYRVLSNIFPLEHIRFFLKVSL